MQIEAKHFLEFLSGNLPILIEKCQPLWHPLGFVSCAIKEESDHIVRVHYWPNGERRVKNPDWPIHTHTYKLSSFILSGYVRDIQYTTLVGEDYSIYKVRYFEGGSEIIRSEESTVIVAEVDEIRHCGEQYYVERGVFHQTHVEFDKSALTIVALSDLSNDTPLVLGKYAEPSYPYDRVPFNRELFWAIVKDVLVENEQCLKTDTII